MTDTEKQLAERTPIIQLIVFNLAGEEYAAEIGQIKEIIKVETITSIPDSPDFIKGVINLRGNIVVIMDLKYRFSLRTEKEVKSKNIIISREEKNPYGLIVDEVTEVLRIPETEIKAPPELVAKIDKKYVSGVVTIANRLIILLDLVKVLSISDLVKLTEVYRKYQGQDTDDVKEIDDQRLETED